MTLAAKGRDTGEERSLDRAWLVAAARAAFEYLGPAASMEEIAGSAGISTAALSLEFANRDDLVDAVLDDLTTSLRRQDDPEPTAQRRTFGPWTWNLDLRQAVPPLALMAALLPVLAAPHAVADAEPAPTPPPSTVLTISPLWPVIPLKGALGGSMCESSCTSVPYMPFFTPGGVRALDSKLTTDAGGANPPATTTVLAFSNGAVVASKWMTEHTGDPDAPSPDELSFVLIGNPRRAHGGSMPAMPPTDYHVIDIVQQYDPLADFPDRPFNLLAMANIAAGIISPLHLDYTGVDLNDPTNIVWTEGNTTYVFVPTEKLPLLAPLRLMGMGKLADALNDPLKEIVEKAYDRPYLSTPETPTPPADVATVSAATEIAAAEKAAPVKDDTTPKPVSRRGKHSLTTAADGSSTPETPAAAGDPNGDTSDPPADTPKTDPAKDPDVKKDTVDTKDAKDTKDAVDTKDAKVAADSGPRAGSHRTTAGKQDAPPKRTLAGRSTG